MSPEPVNASTHAAQFWTPAGLAQATGGTWRKAPRDPSHSAASGICTDTRHLQAGALFVALRGERFDGHTFVAQALEQGACGAMIERGASPCAELTGPLLEVDDTLAALQRLAGAWRDVLAQYRCRVIAVAGSNGKTTTRHLLHTILQDATRADGTSIHGTQSPKSFNNHIGVPLTLLNASAQDDFVVAEIGTNQAGEIDALGAIARPDVALVVTIGQEHLEAFGDVAAVAHEELSLLKHVQPGGLALTPAEDEWQPHMPALPTDVTWRRIAPQPSVTDALALPGAHAAHNASAAAQVARWLDVNEAHIRAALSRATPVPGRFEVRALGSITLIDDAYNANPDSVRAALSAVIAQWPNAARRVFIFGDMRELGAAAADAHRAVGRWLAEAEPGFELLVAVGPLATFAASELRRQRPAARVHAAPQWEDALPGRVATMLAAGDVVLLKGSRAMALERLMPAIEQRFQVSGSTSKV